MNFVNLAIQPVKYYGILAFPRCMDFKGVLWVFVDFNGFRFLVMWISWISIISICSFCGFRTSMLDFVDFDIQLCGFCVFRGFP